MIFDDFMMIFKDFEWFGYDFSLFYMIFNGFTLLLWAGRVDFGQFCKNHFTKSAKTQGNRHKRIKYMTNLYFDKFKFLRKSVRIFLKGPRPAKPPYKPSFLHFHFDIFKKSWKKLEIFWLEIKPCYFMVMQIIIEIEIDEKQTCGPQFSPNSWA